MASDKSLSAIVLAGGLGTRIRDQIPNLPKCLAPVGGTPFLEIFISYWQSQGVRSFILSTGHLHERLVDYVKTSPYSSCITLVPEEKPLGTGGAIAHVLRTVKMCDRFLILNGDTLFRIPLKNLIQFHEEKKSSLTMALKNIDNSSRYGAVLCNSEERVTSFRSGLEGSAQIYGGVAVCEDPSLFLKTSGPASLETELIPAFIQDDTPVYGKIFEGLFLDIGTPESFLESQSILKEIK